MSLSPEQLRIIAEYTASIVGKINQVLANRITTTFTNSNDVIPSSKLVKDEFAAVRSEMPTNTSDLTNDGADGTHAFIVEGDSRLDDTRNPKPHNQASSTITDTNTYSNIGNTLQNQASINSAINEKIGALMNLDFIEQVSTRPTASADTLNKIYAVPENDPTSENLFQYFITIYKDNAYKWDKIDIAQVDISGKVDKVEGKQLSTEDYTTAEKTKLSHIEPEANKTIVDSAFINNSTNPVQSNVIQSSLNSKANVRDLAAVATSGNYNDLSNKPNVVEKSATSGLIKNDGTIDTNQYITEDNIPESFNYGYVDSNLVLHLICVDGEVRVLHSIIQSGDANTISTVITDKDNNPLGGIPVDFLFNGVKQGQSVNSDANGVSTYNYTGTGAGKVDVQVRVGTFQSETYSIEDCIIYDSLTSASGKWTIPSGVTSEYSSDGWKISANGYKQIKLTDKLTTACSVEFTVVDYTTPSSSKPPVIVYQYTNGETTPNQEVLLVDSPSSFKALGNTISHAMIKGGVYKIEYTDSTIKLYENDTLLASVSNSVGLPTRFEWHMGTNRYAIYKDLKVKPL